MICLEISMTGVLGLRSRLIAELYETIDDEIRESLIWKKKWNIEQLNELLDIIELNRFRRTGYRDKETGEFIYLLDKILGIEGHQRITLEATACVLEEVVQTRPATLRAISLMDQSDPDGGGRGQLIMLCGRSGESCAKREKEQSHDGLEWIGVCRGCRPIQRMVVKHRPLGISERAQRGAEAVRERNRGEKDIMWKRADWDIRSVSKARARD